MPPHAPHPLHDHMAAAARRMGEDYARIRAFVRTDPGTAGDQGEETWATLLREWLPPAYRVVTKGQILGYDGTAGPPQVDVIILSPSYPPALVNQKLFLADGVAAAFECKLTLRAAHLDAAARAARVLRARAAPVRGTPHAELHGGFIYGLLAHSSEWAPDRERAHRVITTRLEQADRREAAHPRDMLDVVCVADLGSWALSRTTWLGSQAGGLERHWVKTARGWVRASDPEGGALLAAKYGPAGAAATAFMSDHVSEDGTDQPLPPFAPLLTSLYTKLAWRDPSLRPLADYLLRARLMGRASGAERVWSADIYSEPIRDDVQSGRRVTADRWNPWGPHFL